MTAVLVLGLCLGFVLGVAFMRGVEAWADRIIARQMRERAIAEYLWTNEE